MIVGVEVLSFISNQVKDIFPLPDQGPLYVFEVCELIVGYFRALVTTDEVNNVHIGVLNSLTEFCHWCGASHRF